LAKGNKPKNVILQWSEELMLNMSFGMMKSEGAEKLNSSFRIPNSSFAYAIYEHLMNYWAETLQDDCYLISRDGWKVELLPPAKKNASWEDYFCDLLPVEVVVEVTFAEERDRIVRFKTELEEVTSEIASIDEKLADEEGEDEIDEDALKVERKKYEQKAKTLKKSIKEANEDLIRKLVKSYGEMEEDEIKGYVIDHKWAIALTIRFTDELKRVKAAIVSDVQALANRYAEPLPDAEAKVLRLEKKVAGHLAAMGIGN
jgi:type I restriction enzyme M protein